MLIFIIILIIAPQSLKMNLTINTFLALLFSAFCLNFSFGQTGTSPFTEEHTPEIKITLRQDNWSDILDSLAIYGDNMIVGALEIDGVKYPNVGVRFSGGAAVSPQGKKYGFMLQLDYIHPDQNHQGYPAFKLSNALRDPSFLREYTAAKIASNYVAAPEVNFAKVYINDTYQGMYLLVENVDQTFASRRLGGSWTTMFDCNPKTDKNLAPGNCTKGTFANLAHQDDINCYLYNYKLVYGDAWSDLTDLTKVLDKEPSRIATILDVDAVLWMHALNNVMGNLSSYSGRFSKNYALIRKDNGQFLPVMMDFNLAFGSYKNTGLGSDLTAKGMEKLDPFLHHDNPAKPLIQRLLSNELYKKMYISHLRQINNEHFRDDKFTTWTKSLQKRIEPIVSKEIYDVYSLEDFKKSLDKTIGTKSQVPGLASYVAARSNYIRKDKDLRLAEPKLVNVTLKERTPYSTEMVENFQFSVLAEGQPVKVYIAYRFAPEAAFTLQDLTVKEVEETLENGQVMFGAVVTPQLDSDEIEYYLILENAGAVSFYPENYYKETISVSLSDLNK